MPHINESYSCIPSPVSNVCELLFQLILVLMGFVLLLFATLSAPYINRLALDRLLVAFDQAGSKVTGDLNLGVFGFCASAITIEIPMQVRLPYHFHIGASRRDSNEPSTSSCSTLHDGHRSCNLPAPVDQSFNNM